MLAFLMRHCSYKGMQTNAFATRHDNGLDEKGRLQAKTVGDALLGLGIGISQVITSTSPRAIETGKIISAIIGCKDGYSSASLLDEVDFGILKGIAVDHFYAQYGALAAIKEKNPIGWKFPGGESISDAGRRARHLIQSLASGKNTGNALLVTHAGFMKAFCLAILGLPYNEVQGMHFEPCSAIAIRPGHPVHGIFINKNLQEANLSWFLEKSSA